MITSSNGYEDFWTRELQPLLGGIVEEVIVSQEDEGTYYGIKVLKEENGIQSLYLLWFLRDEEDNGPGVPQVEVEELE
jgi:hypothetical protein